MNQLPIMLSIEASSKLIRAEMSGLLTVDEVRSFGAEEQSAVRRMGLRSGEFDLLVLTEGATVQTQPVMDAFRDLMVHSPLKARKIATVRTSPLARMQSRRIGTVRGNSEVFDNITDAYLWLAE
jgi:hypothetical protein